MTVDQISVFIENKPESLSKLTDILAKNKISMRAMMLADTSDFGIARIIVDDAKKAEAIIKSADYIVKTTGVIAIQIPDEAGSLNNILKILGDNGRNVEYMYGFTGKNTNSACMILRTTDIEKTIDVLKKSNIRLISQEELSKI